MICLMEVPPLFRRVGNIQYSMSVGLYSNPGLNSSGQSGVPVNTQTVKVWVMISVILLRCFVTFSFRRQP